MWILIISGFLAFIAVLLINSSCDCRFTPTDLSLKQMVGATKSFIRKPFVMRSIKLGMLGAGLIIALIGVLLYVETSFPDLGILDNKILIAAVLLAVLGIVF
jgi:cell division transport system permease protein